MTKLPSPLRLAALMVFLLPVSLPLKVRDSSANRPAEALHALFDAEGDYEMEQHPSWASQLGDRRWHDLWEGVRLAPLQKRYEQAGGLVAGLKKTERRTVRPR